MEFSSQLMDHTGEEASKNQKCMEGELMLMLKGILDMKENGIMGNHMDKVLKSMKMEASLMVNLSMV